MKQLTSYNRVAGYLNKLFDLLNDHYFENALVRPTITIQSTPRAYGHFSMRDDTWVSVTGNSNEINIGAGTLARPIENVCATLLHEMVHYYCHVNGIKDTSRGNTYHNKRFKEIAESHGLIVAHDEKYGWTLTSPSDDLIEFILQNELTDILITRNEFYGVASRERERTAARGHQSRREQPAAANISALAAETLCGQRSVSISLVWIVARRWCLRDETDTKKQRPMCEPKKPYIGRFFVKVEEYEP